MPPKSKEPSEADIVFNRANVALAKSQRLIASWLPQRTPEELANAKTEEELEKEDQDLFAPVPELLGVGAPLPKESGEGLVRRKDTSSLDALRKQLLGRHATARTLSSKRDVGVTKPIGRPKQATPPPDSDDEEDGRASVFTSRKKRPRARIPTPSGEEQEQNETQIIEEVEEASTKPPETASAKKQTKRKASSFLDEMLAEKAKKKSRKKNKQAVEL